MAMTKSHDMTLAPGILAYCNDFSKHNQQAGSGLSKVNEERARLKSLSAMELTVIQWFLNVLTAIAFTQSLSAASAYHNMEHGENCIILFCTFLLL